MLLRRYVKCFGSGAVTGIRSPQKRQSRLTLTMSANVRLRWEYQPGSELFVVYNEERDTAARAFPSLSTRALIVKVNRLWRF